VIKTPDFVAIEANVTGLDEPVLRAMFQLPIYLAASGSCLERKLGPDHEPNLLVRTRINGAALVIRGVHLKYRAYPGALFDGFTPSDS
jgi:hypothetical protein